jgi:hypothetical protein
MIRKLAALLITALTAVTALTVTAGPATAAASPPRYAWAHDAGNTVVVQNYWKRAANVVDTTTGVTGRVLSWGATTAIAEPAGPCVTDVFFVGWDGGGYIYYYWPVNCGAPTTIAGT